jgi:hypothetical protein
MRTTLQKYIHEKQLYVMNLRIRLTLIRTNYCQKGLYEINEIHILEHETKQIIANSNKIIEDKTNKLLKPI